MRNKVPKSDNLPEVITESLVHDIRELIVSTRTSVATAVNAGKVMMYWNIGERLNRDILKGERAEYGKQIVHAVSAQLQTTYGKGFSEKSLRRMIQFFEYFSDKQIVASLMRQLSWTHFTLLIPLKKPLQREFYAEMCRIERWSTRELQKRIDSMLYERTALSKKQEELIADELQQLRDESILSPDMVFKDPYMLDFLGVKDHYYEKDLEDAILREMEQFILELGSGFAFLARQKRIMIDSDDFYIDLLFYNRRLKRLVVIDLKMRDFKVGDKAQMELYLRWLDKHEREADELPPLGIILCAGKKQEQIELLEMNKSGIHVAEYLTDLPPRELLESKLHEAIAAARERFDNRIVENNEQQSV